MKIKEIAITLAVLILGMFVVVYGISTFYERPQYENFCNSTYYEKPFAMQTEILCNESGGLWSVNPDNVSEGYCDSSYYCSKDFNEFYESYSKNIFFITLPIGIILLLVGAYFFKIEYIGAGIMLSGIGAFIYGITGYWKYSQNWLRFAISLIGLAFVIWFAYWLEKRRK